MIFCYGPDTTAPIQGNKWVTSVGILDLFTSDTFTACLHCAELHAQSACGYNAFLLSLQL